MIYKRMLLLLILLISGCQPIINTSEGNGAQETLQIEMNAGIMSDLNNGKIGSYQIGTPRTHVISEHGEPNEIIFPRNTTGERYGNFILFFEQEKVSAIMVQQEGIKPVQLQTLIKQLGEPTWEGEDGFWTLNYESGDYQMWLKFESNQAEAELIEILVKKK